MKRLKKIGNRRFPTQSIVTQEIARSLTEASVEINRQIGVLVNRQGYIETTIVGDTSQVFLPDLKRTRVAANRLRGVRLVHTHLNGEDITDDDITDLVILRLDLVAAITMNQKGLPDLVHTAFINPDLSSSDSVIRPTSVSPSKLTEDCLDQIESIETEFGRSHNKIHGNAAKDRAILVGLDISTGRNERSRSLEDSLAEMNELCKTAEIHISATHTQSRPKVDPKTVIGKGKLKDIVFESIRTGAEIMIFDREITPAQAKNLSDFSDLKIIDRTQLILDIFARHARSQDGKLQVELAQLRYLRNRLSEKDDNMSRLTGGIGGRGPGETKLEVGRRKVGDRIAMLERQLKKLQNRRQLNRSQRHKAHLEQMSIIGYTNAGKSTLLNVLTNSDVIAEDKLFATLDPTTRRIRFPEDRELILADTVGFIHDLPEELVNAFRATLEELHLADLLLHVVDATDSKKEQHISSVEKVLADLEILDKPRLIVFNKIDNLDDEALQYLRNRYPTAEFVSAIDRSGLSELVTRIQQDLYGLSFGDAWQVAQN